jgi:predicted lysophospholipase L1 biosynthesis ABC-type transport system permease subunit
VVGFFIQGRTFELEVTSLREIERTAGPFFFVQFAAEQFADAPKTFFWTVNVAPEDKEALQQTLVDELGPHLSFVDTDEIIATVQDITSDVIAVVYVLLSLLVIFVLASIGVCLEAMHSLKTHKVTLYGLLGATTPMIRRSLYSEQGAVFGVALSV